jgi:hypothetical protein
MPAGLDELLDLQPAELTCIGSGYEFTEGPVWLAADPDFGRWNDWIGQQRSRRMGHH